MSKKIMDYCLFSIVTESSDRWREGKFAYTQTFTVKVGTVEGHEDWTLIYIHGLGLGSFTPGLDLDLLSNFVQTSLVDAKKRGQGSKS